MPRLQQLASTPSAAPATALLEIIESMPVHPRSGDLLGALVRAERAGFERGFHAATQHAAVINDIVLGPLLRRQAE